MLPHFVIIGAMKAGTTSLHGYLELHPDVAMSEPKELHFFSFDSEWKQGRAAYETHFRDAPTIGEASPSYTKHPQFPGVPARMAEVLPDAQLVYVVRDPVERIMSQYVHDFAAGRRNRPLDEELLSEPFGTSIMVTPSLYHDQLSRFLDFYPRERIHVMTSTQLRHERRAALTELFAFLGLTTDGYPFDATAATLGRGEDKRRQPRSSYVRAAASRAVRATPLDRVIPANALGRFRVLQGESVQVQRPTLSDDVRARLEEFLRPDAERFRALSGLALDDWTV